jgi:hypothetical protein
MEAILASVVLPAVIDFFKGAGGAIGRKWFGVSVDDEVKLMAAQVEQLKALAELDNPHGTPSQWVVDMRGAFRYICAVLVILIGLVVLFGAPDELKAMGVELIGMPFGFIFGERMYLGLKGKYSK